MVNEVTNDSQYRLKPTLRNALSIVVVYVLILIGMEILSGVPYTDVAKSSQNLLFGILIPVLIGSIFLTIIAVWSGWWKDVWIDQYKIKDYPWMHIFLILFVIMIIANMLSGSIRSLDPSFIIVALIATAFVGYSEELLTRGLLIRGARGSGYTEIKVFLIVMVVFGCIHGLNVINGQAILPTIQQVVLAGLSGGVFYTIYRKTGLLVVPMIIHALMDFSILTMGAVQSVTFTLVAAFATYLSYVLLIFAALNFNVKKTSKEEINT
jgi:membrane protease YdiL (CAAX protease family)